ncbi:MAG: DUF370 domain-containing protein [Clostridia bacterium]|nr:DUF370 domain-containing protein [Clostridia bacterium]
MYLHIGNNRNIRKSRVIGIFDMDNATVSQITRKYLNFVQKDLLLETATYEIPKSFVLYEEHGESKVCFSPLSVAALKGRMEEN